MNLIILNEVQMYSPIGILHTTYKKIIIEYYRDSYKPDLLISILNKSFLPKILHSIPKLQIVNVDYVVDNFCRNTDVKLFWHETDQPSFYIAMTALPFTTPDITSAHAESFICSSGP